MSVNENYSKSINNKIKANNICGNQTFKLQLQSGSS